MVFSYTRNAAAIIFVSTLLLSACVPQSDHDQVLDQLTEANARIEGLRDDLDELAQEYSEIEAEKADLLSDYRAMTACSDEIGCVEILTGEKISLASALVLSDENKQLGLDSQRGVEIAIDNQASLLGHEIELIAFDEGCTSTGGREVGEEIVADPQIVAVVGTNCSGSAVTMAPIISEAGYVMVSPSNTSPALTDESRAWQPGYLRTAHNDYYQGVWMAHYAYNILGLRTAAAIHDGDGYVIELMDAFLNTFWNLGGDVQGGFQVQGDDDLQNLLTELANSGPPEILFFPLFGPQCVTVVQEARSRSAFNSTVLASADGCVSSRAAEFLTDRGEGTLFSIPDIDYSSQEYSEFERAYRDKYGTLPISVFHPHAFDAANMIFACIESVAIVEPNGRVQIGRQALRDCLYETCGFEGLSGSLTCREHGDCGLVDNFEILRFQDGDYESIYP